MPLSALYKTPIDFVFDLAISDTNPANRLVQSLRAQFAPNVDGFSSGVKMWNEKYRADAAKYAFEQKYKSAKTWTQEAEDDGNRLYTLIATYLAKYDRSSPAVQQADRIAPDPLQAPTGIYSSSSPAGPGGMGKPVSMAPSSMRPSTSSMHWIVVVLGIVGLAWYAKKESK